MYLDIHSHILPDMDDGASDLSVSLNMLKESKNQGITDIIATPHFYPLDDTLEEFLEKRDLRFSDLCQNTKGLSLPNIIVGCEVLYYCGLSNASSLEKLTLGNSKYILLEPDFCILGKQFQNEILHLKELGFIPIIAHVERYHKVRGYKKFLAFLKENKILVQVNATSFFGKHYTRTLKKLVTEDIITYIASDAHSCEHRPPMIKDALDKIEALYGTQYKQKYVANSQDLLKQICKEGSAL